MIKTCTLNGRIYNVITGEYDGFCSTYKNERELVIMGDPETRKFLETTLHETSHGCKWDMPENRVRIISHDQACLLWRMGYRIDPTKSQL